MTFLPIVERELRVRARQKITYRFRTGGALVAITIVAFMLVIGGASQSNFGEGVFVTLAWMAFIYCLLEGVRNTADCLSEEKRAGTLGLLFLTDLKGYDVVLGKLMATSLNSVYGLLAIFPPLALPMLLGGVTAGEFWRLVLALMNTLFFSLTAGLFVSAASRSDRKAWAITLGIILFFTIVAPMFRWLPFRAGLPGWASPSTTFLSLYDAAYSGNPGRYWQTLCGVHVLSWVFLISASLILPRSWQDRPVQARKSHSWPLQRKGDAERDRKRRRLLDVNPILWAAELGEGQKKSLWLFVGLACFAAISAWLIEPGSMPIAVGLSLGARAVHFVLTIWVASQACYLFAGGRESGVLELLAGTPLTPNDIVQGHLLALQRLFARPVLMLLCVEMLLLGCYIYFFAVSGTEPFRFVLSAIAIGLFLFAFVMDLHAAARFGLWMGLTSKKPSQALTKTVLYVLILPQVPALCCGILSPVLLVVKDFIFINYAQDQLRRRFRSIVTEGFASREKEGWLAAAPDKAYPQLISRTFAHREDEPKQHDGRTGSSN